MRRSTQVAAPLLAASALALISGCRHPEMQRCVDELNHVVDDKFCANLPPLNPSSQQPLNNSSSGGYVGSYHYYYGGTGSRTIGSTVSGGSFSPSAGHSYSTGTSRGGFGHSMSSGHSGGE